MALDKAAIINLQTGEQTQVMFNPEEYSLSSGNTFAEIGIPGLQNSPVQYVRGNIRTLKMELFFDTYEKKSDVRKEVGRITSLMDKDTRTQAPPILLFSWGTLQFRCVLENADQQYTMFSTDGTPVRAKLSVNFKEYNPVEIEISHGLFIGPPTVRTVMEGENLSRIAGEVLGDPREWRQIAEMNNVDNPLQPGPGTILNLPTGKSVGANRRQGE